MDEDRIPEDDYDPEWTQNERDDMGNTTCYMSGLWNFTETVSRKMGRRFDLSRFGEDEFLCEEFIEFIKNTLNVINLKDWFFVFERGLQKQRLHVHFFFHLAESRGKRCAQFGKEMQLPFPGIHIKPICNPKAFQKYCFKLDETFVKGPFGKDEEKVKLLSREMEVEKFNKTFNWAKEEIDFTLEDLYVWQREIYDFLINTASRKLNYYWWVIDGKGCAGKTDFSNLLDEDPAIFKLTASTSIGMKHIAAQYPMKHAMIVDLSRCLGHQTPVQDIYNSIEDIRCGKFNDEKYHSQQSRGRKKSCVVFSNYPPNPQCVTYERLRIFVIEGSDKPLRRIFNLDEAYEYLRLTRGLTDPIVARLGKMLSKDKTEKVMKDINVSIRRKQCDVEHNGSPF